MTAFFAVIGSFSLWQKGSLASYLFGVAAAFAIAALLRPSVLAPLTRLWMRLGELLHRVVSPIAIGLIFFFVITPYALVMRLAGRDALLRRLDPSAASYWVPRPAAERGAGSFLDQF